METILWSDLRGGWVLFRGLAVLSGFADLIAFLRGQGVPTEALGGCAEGAVVKCVVSEKANLQCMPALALRPWETAIPAPLFNCVPL